MALTTLCRMQIPSTHVVSWRKTSSIPARISVRSGLMSALYSASFCPVSVCASGPDPTGAKITYDYVYSAAGDAGTSKRFSSGVAILGGSLADVFVVSTAAPLLPFLKLPPRQSDECILMKGMSMWWIGSGLFSSTFFCLPGVEILIGAPTATGESIWLHCELV